jgi:hypothetical protein
MSFPQNWSVNSPNLILSSINKSPTTSFVLFCTGLSQDVLIFEIEYSDSLTKAQFSKIANRNVHISAFQYLLKRIVNKCYCIGGCEFNAYYWQNTYLWSEHCGSFKWNFNIMTSSLFSLSVCWASCFIMICMISFSVVASNFLREACQKAPLINKKKRDNILIASCTSVIDVDIILNFCTDRSNKSVYMHFATPSKSLCWLKLWC